MRDPLKPKETGLSSIAAPAPRFCWRAFLIVTCFAVQSPVAAQDDGGATQSASDAADEEGDNAPAPVTAPRRQYSGIDLSVTVPRDESDELLQQDCEEEADAGRIAGEIVVCRQLGEASDGSWNKDAWEKNYAERTKGGSTPNTFGIPNHGNPIGFGRPPPPALLIDVEALPQAPAGSDADRIARGLPPLGKDPEPTPEEIAERRRKLGLEAPPIPGEPE